MHITNQTLSFDIFTVGHLLNIFMEHDLNDFGHKIKMDNFDPYSVFWAIALNIPQRLKTGFVLQGHTHRKYRPCCESCLYLLSVFRYTVRRTA